MIWLLRVRLPYHTGADNPSGRESVYHEAQRKRVVCLIGRRLNAIDCMGNRASSLRRTATLPSALQSVDTAMTPRWQTAVEVSANCREPKRLKTSHSPKLPVARVCVVAQAKLRAKQGDWANARLPEGVCLVIRHQAWGRRYIKNNLIPKPYAKSLKPALEVHHVHQAHQDPQLRDGSPFSQR